MYRKRLIIDHTQVLDTDQVGFPVLVSLADASLKSTAHGGHVAGDEGTDIFFTAADGETRMVHEVAAYVAGLQRVCRESPLPIGAIRLVALESVTEGGNTGNSTRRRCYPRN